MCRENQLITGVNADAQEELMQQMHRHTEKRFFGCWAGVQKNEGDKEKEGKFRSQSGRML